MKIYIPTIGRVDKQTTWSFLPESLRKKTVLITNENEVQAHRDQGRNAVVCPDKGIANVWAWMLKTLNEPVLMLEDDLRFFVRANEDKDDWRLRKATTSDLKEMYVVGKQFLERGYVHFGISARQDAPHWKHPEIPYTFCKRQCRAWGFLPEALRALGVKFRVPYMSDFDTALQLNRLGYLNPFLTQWCVDQAGASGAQGGASGSRTAATHADSARLLHKLHPPFVKLVTRTANWGKIQDRLDVQVSWKAAGSSSSVLFGDFGDLEFLRRNKPSMFAPPIVIHENKNGVIKHRPFSQENWLRSLEDKSITWRWAHRADLNCKNP